MYEVYSSHARSNIKMPNESSIDSVRRLAEASARLGYDAFYRIFRITETGVRFETAFSVLGGVVTEWKDVSFPMAHW